MNLLHLPSEILLCIGEALDNAASLSSFARTTRRTYQLLQSTLYKFNLQRQNGSALPWAIRSGRLPMVKTLVENYQYDVNIIYGARTPLIDAIASEQTAVVDFLLANRKICVNLQTSNGQCALWFAAALGQARIVRALLQRDGIEVDTADYEHRLTPLSVAVLKGHERVVEYLLQTQRVDVNAKDRGGRSSIFHAISGNHVSVLKIILRDNNLSLFLRDRRGNTPLIYSVRKDQPAATKLLLSRLSQPQVDDRDWRGRTALWHAVRNGNMDLVQMLLEKGADMSARDVDRVTPLHQAVLKGNPSVVRMLLQVSETRLQGRQGLDGEQPLLCLAATRGCTEIVRLLLEHGWDVDEADDEGRTPLHLASAQGHRSTVMILLNHAHVNVNARDQTASTALHEAAAEGHLEVVKLLLAEENIDINAKDRHARTPLWLATACEHESVAVRLLAEPNIAVNAVGREIIVMGRSTSLHHVVKKRNMRIVQLLLTMPTIDPNLTDPGGYTALSWAAMEGDLEMVDCLLTCPNTQVNATGQDDIPPLWSAANNGHVQVVLRLLQCQGIDINQAWCGRSPILVSVGGDHVDVSMQLLACGQRLDVSARTYSGESILSVAAGRGHLQVVDRLLRDPRTNLRSVDDWGRTALWWAAHAGQTDVVKLLLADNPALIHVVDDEGKNALETARSQCHFDTFQTLQAHYSGYQHIGHWLTSTGSIRLSADKLPTARILRRSLNKSLN